MALWIDLEKQGIHRCSVMYSSGKQCRRRASAKFGSSWCEKHGPEMEAHTKWHMKIVEDQKRKDDK